MINMFQIQYVIFIIIGIVVMGFKGNYKEFLLLLIEKIEAMFIRIFVFEHIFIMKQSQAWPMVAHWYPLEFHKLEYIKSMTQQPRV